MRVPIIQNFEYAEYNLDQINLTTSNMFQHRENREDLQRHYYWCCFLNNIFLENNKFKLIYPKMTHFYILLQVAKTTLIFVFIICASASQKNSRLIQIISFLDNVHWLAASLCLILIICIGNCMNAMFIFWKEYSDMFYLLGLQMKGDLSTGQDK
ncbi:hypothetical protein ACJX0J_008478, partial [Zea mays]